VTAQLETWRGEFGRAYTDRNLTDPATRLPAFETMVGGLGIASALEIGCNAGHNLLTLRRVLGEAARLAAVEPSPYARAAARDAGLDVVDASAAALPFADASFDLVFTCGVLIHVPPAELEASLRELHRVSARWLLAAEYFAGGEEVVPYRGHEDLLWRRDYEGCYCALFPELRVVRSGYWDREDGFDRSHWWLLEKPA